MSGVKKLIYGIVFLFLVLGLPAQSANAEEMTVSVTGQSWEAKLTEMMKDAMDNYRMWLDINSLKIPFTEENQKYISAIYEELVYGDPNYFYMYKGLSYMGGSYFSGLSFSYVPDFRDENGKADIELIEACKPVYLETVRDILSLIDEDMTEVEKLTFLHDYLIRECEYDWDFASSSYTAYGALINKEAVCQGYAEAYQLLAKQLGFSCITVHSPDMDHAWNMVYVDGNWYHVDNTWDDGSDWGYNVSYQSFLQSDAEMEERGYNNWVGDVPTADASGAYEGYLFRNSTDEFRALNYYDGRWYYLQNGRVMSAELDGSDELISQDETGFSYMHAWKGVIYLANGTGVYVINDLDIDQIEPLMEWADVTDMTNAYLREFLMKDETLIGAIYRADAPVEYITLDKEPQTIEGTTAYSTTFWDDSFALDAVLTCGVSELTYTVEDESILTLTEEREVIAKAPGTTNIIITAEGNCLLEEAELVVQVTVSRVFSDVNENAWYDPYVEYAYENNLVSGKGTNEEGKSIFEPNTAMTRAEFVQVLYSKESKPAVEYIDVFSDVPEGKWYTNAIMWANSKGIVAGSGDRFDVNGKITREQMATIFRKYAEYKGYDVNGAADLAEFADTDKISSWAVNNVKWAIHYGIMSGTTDKRIAPTESATRAQAAAMLKSFIEEFE